MDSLGQEKDFDSRFSSRFFKMRQLVTIFFIVCMRSRTFIFKIFCVKPVFMLYGREDAWGNPRIFRCFKLPSA